ncbi:hypothetical protein OHB12_02435 [Nocardia sp. NBC_01730]|nr:hypothetical protein OHB12_02435 [Nocardia sp. NBC_01730]
MGTRLDARTWGHQDGTACTFADVDPIAAAEMLRDLVARTA